jgi:endoglycosylceramidase
VRDPNVGFAFHDYCATEAELQTNLLCTQLDALSLSAARRYSTQHDVPWLMTEWGATNDLANLGGLAAQADRNRLGWLEWAYTGNDKTSTSPTGQALVYDPAQPPTGANVNQAKLAVLAEPYPQVIAGTPSAWSYRGGVFRLRYTPARPGGGTFAAGSVTVVATPAVAFPDGYAAQVSGGHVVSAPGAATLLIASDPGATSISVTVTAP